MKPLTQLTNIEKAGLLHELFPQEIPAVLDYTCNMCHVILEDQSLLGGMSPYGLTSEQWLVIATEIRGKTGTYKQQLERSSRVFAVQLFEGSKALFTVHCMRLYTMVRHHTNRKFSAAIDLLFNP